MPAKTDRLPRASKEVIAEWLRRVEAEYRSAALTQELTLWLIRIAVSPDLVSDGLRIVKDELRHAELSFGTYRAAGGREAPRIVRESLGLARREAEPLEHDVIRAGVAVFCLGETVAVRLFKELREGCTVPVARRCLDRVLRDEVRHRDFGWALLDALLGSPLADPLRGLVQRELPGMFTRLRASYAPRGADRAATMAPADRAWGLMPTARYAELLEMTLARDYVPRFERAGFDALAAWRASKAP